MERGERNEGNSDENNNNKKNATSPLLSFYSEKKMEKPWPLHLLSLRDIMMNQGPERGVGEEI